MLPWSTYIIDDSAASFHTTHIFIKTSFLIRHLFRRFKAQQTGYLLLQYIMIVGHYIVAQEGFLRELCHHDWFIAKSFTLLLCTYIRKMSDSLNTEYKLLHVVNDPELLIEDCKQNGCICKRLECPLLL